MEVFNSTQPQNNFGKNNYGRILFELSYSKQDLNDSIAICVIHAILCFTALLGNTAIVITIWKTSSLHSATNILLASLAISDLAVGLLEEPLFIAYLLSGTYSVGLLFHVSASIFCSSSFFTITAIAVDRLLALQLHLRYHSVVTRSRIILLVSFIWIFCIIFQAGIWASNLPYISDILTSAVITCVLSANFVIYFKINLVIRHHQRQIQHQQPEANNGNIFSVKRFRKSALNSFLIYIVLLLCNMPHSVAIIMHLTGVTTSPGFYMAIITLISLNSSLNPFLFCWRDREIRAAMRQLFCRGL